MLVHDNPSVAPNTGPVIGYRLSSILHPLDLSGVFDSPRPLEVELGSGDGSFLARYAQAHPEKNFIGLERLLGRIRKLEKKGRRLGLTNLKAIRIESTYFLEYLLPAGSADALHVYFPDPWPKRRHERHRLISPRFITLASRVLVPNGRVFLRTDNVPYYEQMLEVFTSAPEFTRAESPAELLSVVTDFEQEFNAKGIPTLHACFQKFPR